MQLLFRIIAGVATAVGAAVSGKLLYNKGKKNGVAEEAQRAKAEYSQQLSQTLKDLFSIAAREGKRDTFILIGFALGLRCLKSFDLYTPGNIDFLDEYVSGLSGSGMLAPLVRAKMNEYIVSPPNLPTIWAMIEDNELTAKYYTDRFSAVIDAMSEMDETKGKAASDFIAAWQTLVAA